MIKGSIHQEDITIIKVYIPNIRSLKFMKQKLIEPEGEICKSIIIVDF